MAHLPVSYHSRASLLMHVFGVRSIAQAGYYAWVCFMTLGGAGAIHVHALDDDEPIDPAMPALIPEADDDDD